MSVGSRASSRLALFSAADLWCSDPGFATLGGRGVCPVMACEKAVKREANILGSPVTLRCQQQSTWWQFVKKVCEVLIGVVTKSMSPGL